VNLNTAAIDGFQLRIATTPSAPGTLPLLIFNGIGANVELLRGFAEAMGAFGIGVVAFDVPGIGGSSKPVRPYRLGRLARLASCVLAHLGIEGPVDVAGVSWGGALAQEFVRRYRRRVRRLLLAATTAGVFAVPGKWSVLSKMMDGRRYSDAAFMARVGGELYGGKMRADPALLSQFGRMVRPPKGRAYYYQLLAVTGWTSAWFLPLLNVQTLVMMGTDDPIVPLVNGKLLAALLPNARLVEIDDGHLFLLTSAAECAPIVASFLNAGEWPAERRGVA